MLTPLYPIENAPATITVAAPGAAQFATDIPIDALTIALASGVVLDFGTDKFARLSVGAAIGDSSLTVSAIPTALVNGDAATIPGSAASNLLSEKWSKLKTDDDRTALHVSAELMLGLVAPAYTGDDADALGYAVVRQINFMLEHGVTPSVLRQAADSNRGTTTTYRDRWIDPEAALIVSRVTGVQQVRWAPPALAGV